MRIHDTADDVPSKSGITDRDILILAVVAAPGIWHLCTLVYEYLYMRFQQCAQSRGLIIEFPCVQGPSYKLSMIIESSEPLYTTRYANGKVN